MNDESWLGASGVAGGLSLTVPGMLGRMGISRRLFPLTPTLSPKERGNCSPSVGESSATSWHRTRSRALPLPKGESGVRGNGCQKHKALEYEPQAWSSTRRTAWL